MRQLRWADRRFESSLFILTFVLPLCAWADTAPNPLQSAYWRFEEGTNFSSVNFATPNSVLDSINQNHLSAFAANTSPAYTNDVPPTPLKSGLPNTLALDFIPHAGGGDDLFTAFNPTSTNISKINNGIIAAGGGFTLEAAFKPNNPSTFAAIASKEGRPGGSRPEQTLELKTRGDTSLLQIELWDGSGNLKQVSSLAPLNASQWYYAAVVDTGSTLSLYLDSNNGSGYQLQGSVAVSGALYQAVPASPSWDNSWTVGRGQYNGAPADWFDGIIDEVRLSNMALSPSQFLFAGATATLAGDYNNNGKVDAADYVLWRNGGPLANETVTPGVATPEDYAVWKSKFGKPTPGLGSSTAVPEPASWLLLLIAVAGFVIRRTRYLDSNGARLTVARVLRPSRFDAAREMIMKLATPTTRWGLCTLLFAMGSGSATAVANTAPNPLESAYWRFEEGASGTDVNSAVADPVHDSINQNHLDAFAATTAPTYTSSVPPKPLKSGLANTLALDFAPGASGGDDLFTQYNDGGSGKGLAKHINDGIIAPGGGFTVEAAFNTNNPARYAAIVSKEGQPGGSRPVETLEFKTRADNSKLQIEIWDGNGVDTQVSSIAPVVAGQWYYAAAVNNGSTLSLYLDSGSGYQLQGSTPVTGALFQGVPSNPLWDASWTVGRGQYGGNPTDWFDGMIDEVRITNSALTPSQFEFAPAGGGTSASVPEPGTATLFTLAAMSCVANFRRKRGA
jgi:hypothetical protein